ncbi:MAG: hypothetical protein IKY44_05470 [Clostridia bacterium]|nr:hypothetical protein [Clostridia bacterium]
MDLKEYYAKRVKIIDADGTLHIGTVNDYFYPDENDSNVESIVVDMPDGSCVEFTRNDIKTIIVIG